MNKKLRIVASLALLLASLLKFSSAFARGEAGTVASDSQSEAGAAANEGPSDTGSGRQAGQGIRLMASFTVFLLAIFVGFEVITKVPPTLHTPLMSGSNAISGITIVGALLAAGNIKGGFGAFLGMLALLLAFINVMGGFLVTHRMLMMFKKR